MARTGVVRGPDDPGGAGGLGGIDKLIADTRAARDAVHALVTRLRGERVYWEREALALAGRARLTPAQRDRIRDRLAGRRPHDG